MCSVKVSSFQPSFCRTVPQVVSRRARVRQTDEAAAVYSVYNTLHSPHTELLYRDYCELLVRVAHLRYPQVGQMS